MSVVFPGFIRDAGMFHESGAKLPKGVGTSTPEQVAAAVLRAITADKGELDVAPVGMRAGTAFAQIAPEISAKVAKRLGGDKVAAQLASGQARQALTALATDARARAPAALRRLGAPRLVRQRVEDLGREAGAFEGVLG